MVFDFLEPVGQDTLQCLESLSPQSLGHRFLIHSGEDFPVPDAPGIALIGVLENKGDAAAKDHVHLNYIRKQLYALYPGNWEKPLWDLGNLPAGNTLSDTYYALKTLVAELIRMRIVPLVIGGTQDLTYGMYRAYDNLEQMVNLACIDNKFDFGKENQDISMSSYLTRIIVDEPNNLFNYSNIGYQTYYNSQEEIDLIEKLYFDAYRLGEVSATPSIAEPVFRDADIVSLDMTAVESSSSGNVVNFFPNGFSGKEICTLARYAGISDKVSSFGIFNHSSTRQEAALIAQVVWYFIEGVHYRSNEYPFGSKENYIRYIVPMEDEELVFYKSDRTDRWWIEISNVSHFNNKLKNNSLLPCTHDDYLNACDGGIPERLWKAQRKNII